MTVAARMERFAERLKGMDRDEILEHQGNCADGLQDFAEIENPSRQEQQQAVRLQREADLCNGALAHLPAEFGGIPSGDGPGGVSEMVRAFARSGDGASSRQTETPHGPAYALALPDSIRPVRMGAQSTADASGGYTVPTFVDPNLERMAAEISPFLNLVTTVPSETGRTVRVPITDTSSVQAQSIAENTSSADADDLVFTNHDLAFDNFASDVLTLSRELLEDSATDFEVEIVNVLAEWMTRGLADAATTGTGGTNIDGYTEHAKVISALTSATSLAVTLNELRDLRNSVDTRYQNANAGFQFSWPTRARLEKVEIGNRSIIKSDPDNPMQGVILNGVGGPGGEDILAPFVVNPALPDIAASAKAIYFGNARWYRMYRTGDFELLRFTDSPFARKRQVGFMMQCRRAGGLVTAGNPIKFITQKA